MRSMWHFSLDVKMQLKYLAVYSAKRYYSQTNKRVIMVHVVMIRNLNPQCLILFFLCLIISCHISGSDEGGWKKWSPMLNSLFHSIKSVWKWNPPVTCMTDSTSVTWSRDTTLWTGIDQVGNDKFGTADFFVHSENYSERLKIVIIEKSKITGTLLSFFISVVRPQSSHTQGARHKAS